MARLFKITTAPRQNTKNILRRINMTQILKLKCSWYDLALSEKIDNIKVTKEQLETIIDDWLILDEGQFDNYPNHEELYVTKFHLSVIDIFLSTRLIDNDKLFLIDQTPFGYKYLVKENKL